MLRVQYGHNLKTCTLIFGSCNFELNECCVRIENLQDDTKVNEQMWKLIACIFII